VVPDLRGVDLVREWQAAMQSVAASVTGATGRSDAARQLLAPLQRQAELIQEVLERERELQRDLLGRVFEPFDAAFDLFERTIRTLREPSRRIESAVGLDPTRTGSSSSATVRKPRKRPVTRPVP
jgi:hypothetical protein